MLKMFGFDDLMGRPDAMGKALKEIGVNITAIILYLNVDLDKFNECKKIAEKNYEVVQAKAKEEFEAKKKELGYDKAGWLGDMMTAIKINTPTKE